MSNYLLQSLMMSNPALRRWAFQRLVFLFPALCILAALALFGESILFQMKAKRTSGEVVRVYEWKNENPFMGGDKTYGPVFRYTWSDGKETQASAGHAFLVPFKVGSKHTILFGPSMKTDVRTTLFEQLWAVPVTILVLGIVTWILALPIWLWLIRPRIARQREKRLFCLPRSKSLDETPEASM